MRPHTFAGVVALCLGLGATYAAAPSRAAVLPVQRLERERGPVTILDSPHFQITYSAERLTAAEADTAREQAERAWARCKSQFGTEPPGKIHLDLTPNFVGATGFASLEGDQRRGEKPRPLVGVRYTELDYLGLSPEYVLTHEVGHVFSGDLAGSSLGEGIADWAAGNFSGIPMHAWWARSLQESGLWIDPTAFFITGEFGHTAEVDANIRTAQYTESALLVHYLAGRFGWAKVREFAAEYGEARGALESNDERAGRVTPGPRRRGERQGPPDPEKVRAVFQKQFGVSWETLARDWAAAIQNDKAPDGMSERLVLGEKLYGAVRNWEMWALAHDGGPSVEVRKVVRAVFVDANRALAQGKLDEADQLYRRARSLVERLKHPRSVA